jgi:hypothetical protein
MINIVYSSTVLLTYRDIYILNKTTAAWDERDFAWNISESD